MRGPLHLLAKSALSLAASTTPKRVRILDDACEGKSDLPKVPHLSHAESVGSERAKSEEPLAFARGEREVLLRIEITAAAAPPGPTVLHA